MVRSVFVAGEGAPLEVTLSCVLNSSTTGNMPEAPQG